MRWLRIAAKFVDEKALLQFFLEFLRGKAAETSNEFDDEACNMIEGILQEAKLI
jgi:hypothetical protein